MPEPFVLLVPLSGAHADIWPLLEHDLAARFRPLEPTAGPPSDALLAAIVLAGFGFEHEMVDWLDRHRQPPGVPVFAVGDAGDRRVAVSAVRHGASDYFAFPDDLELLRNELRGAVQRVRERLAADLEREPRTAAFSGLVGNSPALQGLLRRAARILDHPDATALLIGETGTGKELLARAIHEGGPRKSAPFVTVNCSALPGNLIESELFGHERGAFTNAHAAKPGLFEVADGGTLFLDELGTLPVDLQAKLLRVLEDREVRRVGATKSRRVNVRIIAATNENLEQAIRAGTFRQDLYYRLSVLTFVLPPLRERGDDVLLLAQHFIERMAKQHGLPVPPIPADVRRALLAYHWPGNIRELKNAVERALLLSPPGELAVDELLPGSAGPASTSASFSPVPFPAPLDDVMTAAARATLDLCDGNRSEAARRLGISRRRLRRLLAGNGFAG